MSDTAAAIPPAVIILPPPAAKQQPKRKRNHVDHFRTDDDEHAELAEMAREAGLSVDAFCRLKIFGDPGPRSRRSRPTPESRLHADAVIAVNRVGNLVNQGIYALNETALKAPEVAGSRDRLADEIAYARALLSSAVPALHTALAGLLGEPGV